MNFFNHINRGFVALEYAKISPNTFSLLYQSKNSLKDSPLSRSLQILAELRTSQINACGFCCQVHIKEAKEESIPQEKIDYLAVWQVMQHLYTKQELLALEYCEILCSNPKNQEGFREKMLETFTEREFVDLTASISLMNALNRIAIFLKN